MREHLHMHNNSSSNSKCNSNSDSNNSNRSSNRSNGHDRVFAIADRIADNDRVIAIVDRIALLFPDSDRVFAIADRIALLFADSDRLFAITVRTAGSKPGSHNSTWLESFCVMESLSANSLIFRVISSRRSCFHFLSNGLAARYWAARRIAVCPFGRRSCFIIEISFITWRRSS